jgi:hypothetical protein
VFVVTCWRFDSMVYRMHMKQAAMASRATVQVLFPDFFDQISVYVREMNHSAAPSSATHGDAGVDDWDWNEDDQHARGSSPRRSGSSSGHGALHDNVAAKAIAESFASTIVERLQVPCKRIKSRVCSSISCEPAILYCRNAAKSLHS